MFAFVDVFKLIAAFCVLNTLFAQIGNAQTTTVRPYMFGFTIDEQQHRYEKRDERGIVMGEFGFITADGIYHVTVYATDEEGKFRILAMKNYPYETPTKTIDMVIQPKTRITAPTVAANPQSPDFKFGNKACSGCFLPNKNSIKGTNSLINTIESTKSFLSPLSNTFGGKTTSIPSINTIRDSAQKSNPFVHSLAIPSSKSTQVNGIPSPAAVALPVSVLTITKNTGSNVNAPAPSVGKSPKKSETPNIQVTTGKPGNFDSAGGAGSTDSGDLYRFKYILDYNGHTEMGSRNGNKQGKFYSIGEDNIERTIEYVANELGFQPRIRWRKLDANEINSRENKLKDYEFVWFKQQ